MTTANELLNFTFSPAALQQAGKTLFAVNITRLHEVRINKLKKISEEVGERQFNLANEYSVNSVFKKFKSVLDSNVESHFYHFFKKKEMRTLTYSLSYSEDYYPSIFSQKEELDFVLKILDSEWKDAYYYGLINCYLKNWESKHKESSEKLGSFIFGKLRNYDGNRTVLKSLKANIKFFDGKNGDVVLGSELALKNKQIKEATKYLSLPANWFVYPYFSKVIVAYYEKKKIDIQQFIDDLQNALNEHNNSTSNKRLVSKLIIQANSNEFAALQDKVKIIAFKLVGDPANATSWTAFEGANEQEKSEIKQARVILNEWITREFITVFFDLIKEPRRKNYWKKFSKQITGFTIVGPKAVKNTLLRDDRISEYVNGRFRVTESNRTASAFIMRLKDYVLIEFSVSNYAFYALKENHKLITDYETRKIKEVDEFVDGTLPMLAKRRFESIESESAEGRLFHRDGNFESGSTLQWESVFDWWIKKYVGANV
jgi:EH signature protein